MRKVWTIVLGVTFLLSILTSGFLLPRISTSGQPQLTKTYQWTRATEPGRPGWPRWVLPIVGKNGKLWMIAENFSWSSPDGINWLSANHNSLGAARAGVTPAFFKEQFWLMGGMNTWSDFSNEVWSSADGFDWHKQPDPQWDARRNARTVVFDGKLWLLGGQMSTGDAQTQPFRDVWSSSDGLTWTRVTDNAPWREGHAVVFRERIWVIGGGGAWHSMNGRDWVRAASVTALNRRASGCVVLDGKIWIFGGLRGEQMSNDVWASVDGQEWNLVTSQAPWFPRGGEYSIVFDGKLWIFGGKTGSHYREADDIWYMTPR